MSILDCRTFTDACCIFLGCEACRCDRTGSYNSSCVEETGQCYCRDGVTGQLCNECKANHWGFDFQGCSGGYMCYGDVGRETWGVGIMGGGNCVMGSWCSILNVCNRETSTFS